MTSEREQLAYRRADAIVAMIDAWKVWKKAGSREAKDAAWVNYQAATKAIPQRMSETEVN